MLNSIPYKSSQTLPPLHLLRSSLLNTLCRTRRHHVNSATTGSTQISTSSSPAIGQSSRLQRRRPSVLADKFGVFFFLECGHPSSLSPRNISDRNRAEGAAATESAARRGG
ncbi:hypothetical protein LINPERHAP2_LOCUS37081 [Linum perenne]